MDKTPNEFLKNVLANVERSTCNLLQLSIREGIPLHSQRVGVIEMRRDYGEDDCTYIVGYVDRDGNVYGKYFTPLRQAIARSTSQRVSLTCRHNHHPPTRMPHNPRV